MIKIGDTIETTPGNQGYRNGEPIINKYTVIALHQRAQAIEARDSFGRIAVFDQPTVEKHWITRGKNGDIKKHTTT